MYHIQDIPFIQIWKPREVYFFTEMERWDPLLGEFPKLRKATISRIMSVCLCLFMCVCVSDCVEQPAPNGSTVIKIYTCVFRKSVRKIKFNYILTRVTGTVQEGLCTFMIISH